MDAVVEEAAFEDIGEEIGAPAELLPPEIQHPVNIVNGRRELILPNDHTSFTECAEQCFQDLAETKRFFRQGGVVVELVESSEGSKLVELTVEAFRSRLESYFTLRSIVTVNREQALRPKLCSQDNAKALLATEAALKYLPPIQAVVNSPVFAEDAAGELAVLNQGYHDCNGGLYILGKRSIDTTIEINAAIKELLGILESLSEALLSGQPFVVLENVRGQISSQLLESAIRGEGKVAVRRAYSRTTLIDTDHVYWMATSNRAQMTQDLANRSIITRLRKRPFNASFKEYPEGDLLKHLEARSDYYLSCIYAVIREWHASGKPRTQKHQHDFREWSQTLDWIVQNVFKLPPLLDGHRSEQLRISSVGLSFLRDVALVVQKADACNENLSTTELAVLCDAGEIDIPGCAPGADTSVITRRIGSLLGPLFRESESIEVEGFVVKRTVTAVYNEERKENRSSKCYCFETRQ